MVIYQALTMCWHLAKALCLPLHPFPYSPLGMGGSLQEEGDGQFYSQHKALQVMLGSFVCPSDTPLNNQGPSPPPP